MNQQMKRGAIISYLTILFNILSVLLYTPLLIRGLGNSDYAIYTLVYSFVNYFVIDFGIGSSIARFITEFRYNKKEKYTEQQLLSVVCKVFFSLTICLFIVLLCIYPYLDKIFQGLTTLELIQMQKAYVIAMIYTLAAFIATPLESVFTANEYFVALKLCKLCQKAGTIILTVTFICLKKDLVWIMLAGTISGVITILIEYSYLVQKRAIAVDWKYWNFGLLKRIMAFSMWMAIVTFAQRFIIPITPAILGMVSNSLEISTFSVASSLEGYVFMFAAALNGLFLPQVSRLVNHSQYEELNRFQIKVGRIQLFVIGTLLTGATVFGKEFISLWAGMQYYKAYYVFLFIAWSDCVYLTQEIASTTLTVIGEVKYRALVYVAGAAISTSLSMALAPRWGAIGSAVGISICLWGFNVAFMTLVYQRKVKMDMKRFFIECHLKIMPGYLVYGGAWLIINTLLPKGTWFVLLIKCLAFSTILLPIVWTFMANVQEKRWAFSIINKLLRRT